MHIPKFICTLIAVATLVGVAQAESFVRATGSYYYFSNSRYSNQDGLGIAAGFILGDQESHELSLEWNYLKWGYLQLPPAGSLGDVVSGSGKFQPVLFGYRYLMGAKNARVRFYAGPSLGYTKTEGSLRSSSEWVFGNYSGDYSQWSFTYGGSAGVQVLLRSNLSLDVGCRYIVIDGVEASLPSFFYLGNPPLKLNLGDTKALALSLGLHFAF